MRFDNWWLAHDWGNAVGMKRWMRFHMWISVGHFFAIECQIYRKDIDSLGRSPTLHHSYSVVSVQNFKFRLKLLAFMYQVGIEKESNFTSLKVSHQNSIKIDE